MHRTSHQHKQQPAKTARKAMWVEAQSLQIGDVIAQGQGEMRRRVEVKAVHRMWFNRFAIEGTCNGQGIELHFKYGDGMRIERV